MSKRKRRSLSAEFKVQIAKEALEKEKTIQQIAQENDIAPAQVNGWKKELEERLTGIFERKNSRAESAREEEQQASILERKVGQLLIEKEFLEKKCEPGSSSMDLSRGPLLHRGSLPGQKICLRCLAIAHETLSDTK